MKKLLNLTLSTLTSLLMVSCTTVKRDDHSYSYVYQHNEKSSEDNPSVPKPKRNVEYTTYRQEYNNYKSFDSDSEFLDRLNNTDVINNNPNPVPNFIPQHRIPSRRRDFNPYDNQFINSSYKVNKHMEERVPNIFGPNGYVMVESKVPNSNPPIINTYYYPASSYR
jgi:hypothetical protein